MFDFATNSNEECEFKVDTNIYSDAVVSKVLYWLSSDFIISRKQLSPQLHFITLKKKKKCNRKSTFRRKNCSIVH